MAWDLHRNAVPVETHWDHLHIGDHERNVVGLLQRSQLLFIAPTMATTSVGGCRD